MPRFRTVRSPLIAAAVALSFAAISGAAFASGVGQTPPDIVQICMQDHWDAQEQEGQLRAVSDSVHCRAGETAFTLDLTAQQGPPGEQGLPGDDGEDGADGLPGIGGYERIEVLAGPFEGRVGKKTVPCPAGKSVFGGGYLIQDVAGSTAWHVSQYPASGRQHVGGEGDQVAF
jgi:hypothetical protein